MPSEFLALKACVVAKGKATSRLPLPLVKSFGTFPTRPNSCTLFTPLKHRINRDSVTFFTKPHLTYALIKNTAARFLNSSQAFGPNLKFYSLGPQTFRNTGLIGFFFKQASPYAQLKTQHTSVNSQDFGIGLKLLNQISFCSLGPAFFIVIVKILVLLLKVSKVNLVQLNFFETCYWEKLELLMSLLDISC